MTTPSITPLRKKRLNGVVYTRPPVIEEKLIEILSVPREEIVARCSVHDDADPNYLPSECLVHLVRACRASPPDVYFETVYKALAERVFQYLPRAESGDCESERLIQGNIRDEGFHRFCVLLARDRLEYIEKLDFWEVRFNEALARLRTDVYREFCAQNRRSVSIEIDPETGQASEEVERAAGSFEDYIFDKISAADDRLRLDKAIDLLPTLEKAIIQMMRIGIPIDSKEPDVVTIAKTLGRAEKTIRLRRDKAFKVLRETLKNGELP